MGLLDFNPVSWYESAINGKMERAFAEELLGAGLSFFLTLTWNLGKLPLVGPSLKKAAMAMKLNLWQGNLIHGIRITVPDDMNDPDEMQHFVPTQIK